MVDSNDRERITEAPEELQKMVHDMTIIDDLKETNDVSKGTVSTVQLIN